MQIQLTGLAEVDKELAEYPSKVDRAMARALNRGISSARTLMVRELSRETGLASRVVRDKLPMSEATPSRLIARLAAGLKRIPLIDFRARGPVPSRGRGQGVTYRIGEKQGRIPNAFIADLKTGHRGVFRRRGKARLPIDQLYGPSLGHIFGKYKDAATARGLEMFQKNFDHELGFARTAVGDDDGGA